MKYKLNIQNFAVPGTATIQIYVDNVQYPIKLSVGTTWESVSTFNTQYIIQDNRVIWQDSKQGILMYAGAEVLPTDQIINEGNYTIKSAASTPTIKAGTYNFVQHITTPTTFSQTLNFKSKNISFTKIECKNPFGSLYSLFYDTNEVATTIDAVWSFKNSNYRVIEVAAAQEVSQDFYDWFTNNTTDSTSIILPKGKYCFNETLETQTTPIHFENFKVIFSHINFAGLVFSKLIDADASGYFYSSTNTTRIIKPDGTWLNAQSKEFELTEDYDLIANNSNLSIKEAFLVADWFEANTSAGRTYHVLNVNGKRTNTWNHKPINSFNGKYIERKYTFNGSYTNITNNSYVIPTTIYSTDSVQLIFNAPTGYELDATKLNVLNATATIYDSADTNMIMAYISNPIGNVSVTMAGILKKYTITTNLVYCTASKNNAATIDYNGTVTLHFTADEGYQLPDTITVTNAESYTWDKTNGQLTISKPSDNITIAIEATSTASAPILKAGTYQWVDKPDIASLTNALGDDTETLFTFKSYNDTFSSMLFHSYDGSPEYGIRYDSDNDITNHTTKTNLLYTGYSNEKKQFGQCASSQNADKTWINEWVSLNEYKTITLEEDYIPTEEEKEAFAIWYEWAITNGNLVKYEPVLA